MIKLITPRAVIQRTRTSGVVNGAAGSRAFRSLERSVSAFVSSGRTISQKFSALMSISISVPEEGAWKVACEKVEVPVFSS